MTASEEVAEGCKNLRQGDVIADVPLPLELNGQDGCAVAILTQTCDVVQSSKTRCLVAPVLPHDPQVISGASKGRRPLHLLLEVADDDGPDPCVVDMEAATSVLKSDLVGKSLLARYVPVASSTQAGTVAARIGRAFNRFPFPDEVHPFFNGLRSRIRKKSGTLSPFGQALDLVEDIRVRANQWPEPMRELVLFIVVDEEFLIPREDYDPGWTWGETRVLGLTANETLDSLDLNRASELIIANLDGDETTLASLWTRFGELVYSELLQPNLNTEVSSCRVDVLSDGEMKYRDYRRTESLDFEVLSDAASPTV